MLSRIIVLSLIFFTSVNFSFSVHAQYSRPGGEPSEWAAHPDENGAGRAGWTTEKRNALAPRLARTVNQDWTFNYLPAAECDESAAEPRFDDSKWSAVSLPHTWHTYETTGEPHPYIRNPSEEDSTYWWHGWGYYRKRFSLNRERVEGKKIFVEFDGVQKYCRVWLNGHYLGDHKGGFASFYFDLTDSARLEGENVLVVAVNSRRDDPHRIPPMYAGNWNPYGGIYRDVRLVVKERLHIPFQGSYRHEGGTFITTSEVSAERALVRIRTWVRNDFDSPQTVIISSAIEAEGWKGLAIADVRATLSPGEIREFFQHGIVVENPKLWSPETPFVYEVLSTVKTLDGRVVDRLQSPLGFRWFEWNHEENLGYLNGKRLHIHGTNRHQEFPWLGDAIPKWIHVRDLRDMRFGLGHNFTRLTHYTQDAFAYDLCDRYGLLVCEEVPNIKDIDFAEDVQRQQVIEMIRRDRNHPSIVMWSMGNETSDPADSAWAYAEDTTRDIHLRHSDKEEGGKFITHTNDNMDMENLLRCTVRGWTHRDVSPYEPQDNQATGHEEWQHSQAMIPGSSQRGHIDMANGVMWIYADHGADREYDNCPLKHVNPKGWVDLYRIPKYLYYLWQAHYTDTAMAFIHPHYWQSEYIGRKQDIIVDSNCETVELKIDGISLGIRKPTAENFYSVVFEGVAVRRATLRLEGVKGAERVSRSLAMAGPPAQLVLTATHSKVPARRDSVAIVTVDAVDEKGNPVQGYSHPIRWKIEGPARLLTPELYTTDIHKRHADTGVFYISLPVSTVLRSTGETGTIRISAVSEIDAGKTKSIRSKCPLTIQAVAPEGGSPSAAFVSEPPLSDAGRLPVERNPVSGRKRQSGAGRQFIRRRVEDGHYCFIANHTAVAWNDWLPLAVPFRSAVLYDPMTGTSGVLDTAEDEGVRRVYLQLEPGAATITNACRNRPQGPHWPYWEVAGDALRIEGPWTLDFIDGGPSLPDSRSFESLASWTETPDSPAKTFAGPGRYSVRFDLPKAVAADDWLLDPGECGGVDIIVPRTPKFRANL